MKKKVLNSNHKTIMSDEYTMLKYFWNSNNIRSVHQFRRSSKTSLNTKDLSI